MTQYVVLLLSLSVHESAHAWTALRQGDPTAKSLGRISLNPLVHLDLVGTVVLPLVALFSGGGLIGWAKPTPVDPRRFKDLRWGQIVVSGAGPLSNLVLAVLFTGALLLAYIWYPDPPDGHPLFVFLMIGIYLNVLLAIFNLVPLPPLDGSHIVEWTLPNGIGQRYVRAIAPYGGMILIALVVSGALGTVISPVIQAIVRLLYSIVR